MLLGRMPWRVDAPVRVLQCNALCMAGTPPVIDTVMCMQAVAAQHDCRGDQLLAEHSVTSRAHKQFILTRAADARAWSLLWQCKQQGPEIMAGTQNHVVMADRFPFLRFPTNTLAAPAQEPS